MSKASKHRECPAVGRRITAAECGENRISRYACPGDCPFNPFGPANYAQQLEIEARTDEESLKWFRQESRNAPVVDEVVRRMQQLGEDGYDPEVDYLVTWHLMAAQDDQGLTCAQRWERAGFPGLRNDGRVFMRARMSIRVALLEMHRVLDDEQVEAVDLFDTAPEPFIVRDRPLARVGVRFMTGLTWLYELPHYRRIFGSLGSVSGFAPHGARHVVAEIVRHLGGPTEAPAIRRWIGQHHRRFEDALLATLTERGRRLLAAPAAPEAASGARPADLASGASSRLVVPTLLDARVAPVPTPAAPPFPPASGPEIPDDAAEGPWKYDAEYLDMPLSELDGRTPRQAGQDPALRPLLRELLKDRVRLRDEVNLEEGTAYDCNWLLRELGFDDLVFDPPPPGRLPPPTEDGPETDDEPPVLAEEALEDFRDVEMDPSLPLAPPLPDRPFDRSDILAGVERVASTHERGTEAFRELLQSGCTLFPVVMAATRGLVTPGDLGPLMPCLVQVWYTFVPPETRAPNLRKEELVSAMARWLERLKDAIKDRRPDALEHYLQSHCQPDLTAYVISGLLTMIEEAPRKHRPSPNASAILCAVLAAVVEELDRVHRARLL